MKRSRASSCKVCLSLFSPSFPHPQCLVQIPSPQPLASTSSSTPPPRPPHPPTLVLVLASRCPSLPTTPPSRLAPFASMFLGCRTSVSMSSTQGCSDGERGVKNEPEEVSLRKKLTKHHHHDSWRRRCVGVLARESLECRDQGLRLARSVCLSVFLSPSFPPPNNFLYRIPSSQSLPFPTLLFLLLQC
jgi:hypothetical protein